MTTDEKNFLAANFESHRAHLRAVAYRMLGSMAEAEDVVQEAWLRLERTDEALENLGGWLTTVVARVCLDQLRARRREKPLEEAPEPTTEQTPEEDAALADALAPALLVVLDMLEPAERLAFVLHDMFAMPFDAIAPIVGRTAETTRQLASRARRRVSGADAHAEATIARRRELVAAFIAASRDSNFEALLAVLDPNVVARGDSPQIEIHRGANIVAKTFLGRARGIRPALVDGLVGAAFSPHGATQFALAFEFAGDKIIGLYALTSKPTLEGLSVTYFE